MPGLRHRQRRPRPAAASLLLLALLLAPPAAGQPAGNTPSTAPPAPAATIYAPVRVGGRRVLEVAADHASSAALRADRINRRLATLVSRPEPLPPFTVSNVTREGGVALITLGGEPIMTVTQADARDALTTPAELALVWGTRLSTAVQDARAARENPLQGVGILVRNSLRDLILSAVTWLPRLLGVLVLWLVFWLLARLGAAVVRLVAERAQLDDNLRQLARAVTYYAIWGAGLIAILTTLGFESGSILTAVGVSGFVLGFAFKDILSNFLAGLLLLIGREFRIGDQIVVNQYEGTVERVELRALYLRTYDNRLVIIPNGEVLTSAVTSNTASAYRRREFVVALNIDNDLERAQAVALAAARETPGVLADPGPDVLVEEIAAGGVTLRVRFFTGSLRHDFVLVGSDCVRRVKEAFEREGIALPLGIRPVVIRNAEELAAALRAAPAGPSPPAAGDGGPARPPLE